VQHYLLDANHITALYNKETQIIQKISRISPDRILLISQFTRGELEAGHKMSKEFDEAQIENFWQFVNESFYPLETNENTSAEISTFYGEIIGRLHQKYPKKVGKKTEVWLVEIGVQLTDIWLVAQSLSYNVKFVTTDGMDKIKEVVGNEVRFDNWIESS
jgi:predicted nucleic acid-binding protein